MPNLTTVTLTAGVPTAGTGTVSTLDNVVGTAGTPSAQVQTVQGVTSMTPLKVDGSAVTQPVSGTVSANATQTGTWTVQPGNTANTTAWKVDGSAVTQPVSGTVTANQGTANATPWNSKVTDGTTAMTMKAASTGAAAATDTALVVTLRDVNANGQATMANSAPVVIASNQSNLPINIAQVNGSTVPVGSGVQATAMRTTLATDSPGIVTLGQTTKSASVPVTWASDQVGTAGTPNATVLSVQGVSSMTPIIANQTNLYPSGATPITASATGTTAATTATLAGAVGKTTYISGFAIRANATAAATGNATVTGTITGTMNFSQWTAPLASGIGTVEQRFSPPIPASTTNTGIAVVSAAPGSGGVVSVSAWGYQL